MRALALIAAALAAAGPLSGSAQAERPRPIPCLELRVFDNPAIRSLLLCGSRFQWVAE